MKSSRSVLITAAAFVLLGAVSLLGCKSGTGISGLYGGGGGSTGGTTGGNAAFNSGSLTGPATFVHTFANAGTVGYHCNFHVSMGMSGTVTIAAGEADSAVVAASGTSFTPPSVRIRPGGFVRWNVAGGPHTVTSD